MAKIRVERPSPKDLERRGVYQWPLWEKETSSFDWSYDAEEKCYFLKGDVTVEAGGEKIRIKEGDFVTFPKGLRCRWNITRPVRKHYQLG